MRQRRERIIRLVKRRLLRKGWPRLVVSLILLVTGVAGFLVSFLLLHSGMTQMWQRYPLAIIFAYCVFLLLLRLWLSLMQPGDDGANVDLVDLPSVEMNLPDSPASADGFSFSGGGGDAGGGGAGGSWGQDLLSPSSPASGSGSGTASSGMGSSASGGSSSGGGDVGGCLDEGIWIVIAIAAVAGALIAILYVVYVAPALLAEILVDGVLVAGLYKKLKGVEQRHWLRAAVRKTILPALIAALLFSLAGYALQKAAPKARSIGEVWREVMKD
jgi:hypothetical protein